MAAVIDNLLLRDQHAIDGCVVGEGRSDLLRAVRLDGAIEKVCRGIEPGFDARAAFRRDIQDVVALAAVALLACARDLCAAMIGTPPQVPILIGFGDRERNDIAACLIGDGAGGLFLPRLCSIPASRTCLRWNVVSVHEGAALQIFQRGRIAGQALAGIGVFHFQRVFALPISHRGLVGGEDVGGRCGECRRGKRGRQQKRGECLGHGSSLDR